MTWFIKTRNFIIPIFLAKFSICQNRSTVATTTGNSIQSFEEYLCKIWIGRYGKDIAVWTGDRCECINCSDDQPGCENPECNGAPLIRGSGLFRVSKCDTNKCPLGRSGKCCATTTCMNGGEKLSSGQCNCTGTKHSGDFCEIDKNAKLKKPAGNVCKNGGYKMSWDDYCQCPEDFIGAKCEMPHCYNDINLRNGKCDCNGARYDHIYSGKFCERIKCSYGEMRRGRETRKVWCKCSKLFEGLTCNKMKPKSFFSIVFFIILLGGVAYCMYLFCQGLTAVYCPPNTIEDIEESENYPTGSNNRCPTVHTMDPRRACYTNYVASETNDMASSNPADYSYHNSILDHDPRLSEPPPSYQDAMLVKDVEMNRF